jgi:hypothetical protein
MWGWLSAARLLQASANEISKQLKLTFRSLDTPFSSSLQRQRHRPGSSLQQLRVVNPYQNSKAQLKLYNLETTTKKLGKNKK